MSEENQSVACTSCENLSTYLGQIPIRTKGSSGVAKLFFGEWAELGEEKWPLVIYSIRY